MENHLVTFYHPWQVDLEMFFRVIFACFLGCFIGWERERHRNVVTAGIRTYGAIALGACAFAIVSFFMNNANSDPSRIAAQIVTSIGFLGGGIIFRQGASVSGLTTAATLWATAAVGITVAAGMYLYALLITLLIFLLLYLPRVKWWKHISTKTLN